MFLNFEKLYLDVILRKIRTKNDQARLEDIAKKIHALQNQEDSLANLKGIGEQIKYLSRKSNDLCHAHPEIPWSVLILLSAQKEMLNDPLLAQSIDTLYHAIIDKNGLLQELEERLAWQTAIEHYSKAFVQAEYALFHFQLNLQDIYCGFAKAALENSVSAQYSSVVSAAFSLSPNSNITDLLAQLDLSYQNYVDLCKQVPPVSIDGPDGTQISNSAIDLEFSTLQNELFSLDPAKTGNKIMRLYEAFKEKCFLYNQKMIDFTKENSTVKSHHVVDALEAMTKSLQKLIDDGVISVRSTIMKHDLSNSLNDSYWHLTQKESGTANETQETKTQKEDQTELAPNISVEIAALENRLLASSIEQAYPGFALLLETYIFNHLLILKDFTKRMRDFNNLSSQNLITRMAQLYCLVVIGETVNALVEHAPNLSNDEKKHLRNFAACRSALVHAVDSPACLQNLWTLLFETSETPSLNLDALITNIVPEAERLAMLLTQRFPEHNASSSNAEEEPFNLPLDHLTTLTTELRKTATVVNQKALMGHLTAVDSLLTQFNNTLGTDFDKNSPINQYASMFMCSLLGQISRSVLEQSYAYARTIARHLEWQEIIARLVTAGYLRANYCHNLAESYQQNYLFQQNHALPFITTFRKGLEESEEYPKGILFAFEEKALVRKVMRNPAQGSDVYAIHCSLIKLLEHIKKFSEAERRLSAPNTTQNIKTSKKKMDAICQQYLKTLPKASQEKLSSELEQYLNNENPSNEPTMSTSDLTQNALASPSTVAIALTPVKNNIMPEDTLETETILNDEVTNIRRYLYTAFKNSAQKDIINGSALLNSSFKPEKYEDGVADIDRLVQQFSFEDTQSSNANQGVSNPINTPFSPVRPKPIYANTSCNSHGNMRAASPLFFNQSSSAANPQTPEGYNTQPRDSNSTGSRYGADSQMRDIQVCMEKTQAHEQAYLQSSSMANNSKAPSRPVIEGMYRAITENNKRNTSVLNARDNKRQKVG